LERVWTGTAQFLSEMAQKILELPFPDAAALNIVVNP
jgi:hypothetical protein